MIASRTGRAGVRSGPTRFGGSSSATIGSISAHNSSGTRQIVGNGSRSADSLAMSHLLVSRRCSPHARLEIASKVTVDRAMARDQNEELEFTVVSPPTGAYAQSGDFGEM